ncbi:hypothetical protein UP10_17970 [Bradyrhizobium sp. LTSPM299]|uniref:hypothetical protein n=1 Tax=Bradyrhizobium sp. LTSPM299 TaxID=1619233 RepID=UPI0005C8DD15|nr:hypothetical protein [Bradyrhizobium sp. LTSPM299]KJC59396.1 hypothetical protein UP10_17970 [Bradyrhizobium sp. LTSPM299]
MKEKLLATALSATMLFAASLRTANAETWVSKDILRPHGHDRSMAAGAGEDVILAVRNAHRDFHKRVG